MIELNGIQISDNNINTKKNVKIYTDEKQLSNVVDKEVHALKGVLKDLHTPIAISTKNTTEDKAANVAAIKAYVDNLVSLGVDTEKGYMIPVIFDNRKSGIIIQDASKKYTGFVKEADNYFGGGFVLIETDGTYKDLELLTVGEYNSLATIAKTIVGAINELFNGGVKDTSIVGAKLADYTVTSTKIAPRTIIGDNIQNKTIKTEQIADNAITTENIKDFAITSDKIKSESITGYKIPNETILERHLGYWAVTKNKIASGQVTLDKLASSVQDTLGKVGANVKEVKTGEDLFSLEDGIYALNGSTYTNYPIGIPFDASAVCILVVTHSNQRVTLYGVDGSHSSPILPLVAIGDLTNKRWTGGSFYSFFASDYEVGHKLDKKLDNTSSLTDIEVNNIWDNN